MLFFSPARKKTSTNQKIRKSDVGFEGGSTDTNRTASVGACRTKRSKFFSLHWRIIAHDMSLIHPVKRLNDLDNKTGTAFCTSQLGGRTKSNSVSVVRPKGIKEVGFLSNFFMCPWPFGWGPSRTFPQGDARALPGQ